MKRISALRARLAGSAFCVSILAALVVSGCGGGNPSTARSTAAEGSLTKAELIAKGDAICAETDKIQEQRMAAYGKHEPDYMRSKPAFYRMIEAAGLPPVQIEIEKLRALGAPEGEEAKVNAILSGFQKAERAAEADPRFAMGVTEGPFVASAKLARAYGFKACSEPL